MKCIGCGKREILVKHTYCPVCRHRLSRGWDCLETDDIPGPEESARIKPPGQDLFVHSMIGPRRLMRPFLVLSPEEEEDLDGPAELSRPFLAVPAEENAEEDLGLRGIRRDGALSMGGGVTMHQEGQSENMGWALYLASIHRVVACPFYDTCLDVAVKRNWRGWTCRRCDRALGLLPEIKRTATPNAGGE